MNKEVIAITAITSILSLTGLFLAFLWVPTNMDLINRFVSENQSLAPLLLMTWRVLAIVIPPLPGGILSWSLIPVFGWFWSFVYAAIATLIGTSIAFSLARNFREPLVKLFVPLQKMRGWEKKISGETELLGFLILRLTTGPVLDFISYVAGLSKISYGRFILATTIALIPDLFVYYIGGELFKVSLHLGTAFFAALALFIYFKKVKHHSSG